MGELLFFINSNIQLVGGTAGVFLLAVFNELKIKEGDVCGLTPIEAVKMINQNAVVSDLRKHDSYNQKHIICATNSEPENLMADKHNKKSMQLLVFDSGGVNKQKHT